LAWSECRREDVPDVALEASRRHGAVKSQPRPDPVEGEGRDDGFVLASVDRRSRVRALPARRPGIGRRVTQVATGLIYEHQILRLDRGDLGPPSRPGRLVPLARLQRLFFRVWPNRVSARLIVAVLTSTPDRSCHQAHCSANVASARSTRRPGKASMSAPIFTAGGPGTGFAASPPVSRRRRTHRVIVGTDTEKRSATSSRRSPRSIAAITRSRKSSEYGLMHEA